MRGGCAKSVGNRRAFTLVELLVVIAVVAVLVGLLLPALGKARRGALGVRCLSNIRQSGLALSLYMDDHGERFPWGTTPAGQGKPDQPLLWYAERAGYGWGGTHWFGFDETGAAGLGSTGQNIAARPVNPYFELPETSPGFGEIFRCPAENGQTKQPDPMRPGTPPPERPFGQMVEGNSSESPDSVYGLTGTSYHVWTGMYAPIEFFPTRQTLRASYGRKDVTVDHARFVLVGDWGQLQQAVAERFDLTTGAPVSWPNWRFWEGWWHGEGVGHLGYLDGSARATVVGGATVSYTIGRTYQFPDAGRPVTFDQFFGGD
jgi:prepilin-type N-terminal cleavage/methylation domain-containing protein